MSLKVRGTASLQNLKRTVRDSLLHCIAMDPVKKGFVMKWVMPLLISAVLSSPVLASEEENSWEKAKESAAEAWESAKEAGVNAWDATKEKSEELIENAEQESESLWDSAKEKSTELWKKGKEKGSELVDEAEKKADEYLKPKENAPENTTPEGVKPDQDDLGNFDQSA